MEQEMLVVTEEASEPVSPYKERVDCDVSLVLGIQNSPDLQLAMGFYFSPAIPYIHTSSWHFALSIHNVLV
jgi:hypothetical protein